MGDIYCGRCGWIRRRGIPGKGGWFTTKEQSGGGPLIDLGVHMIDLTMWLMGNPTPVAVSGCTYTAFANNQSESTASKYGDVNVNGTFDVEDLAMGFIRFDNGACLQIEFSWASNIERDNKFYELRGTEAGASWSFIDDTLRIFKEECGTNTDLTPKFKKPRHGHVGNIENFADALEGKAEPVFKPQQGIDMIKILCAIYESAKTGKEVIL
jgi:predicted dehydrogenase